MTAENLSASEWPKGKERKKYLFFLFWSQRFPSCGYLLWSLHSPMMNAGAPVLPRPEWGAGISTCHLPPKQAVKPHPATVGFQCWPPPLSPQAEKLFELSWMWSLSKSSQLCFFKEEEPLKHPMGHFLSQPVLHSKDLQTGNTRLRSSLSLSRI